MNYLETKWVSNILECDSNVTSLLLVSTSCCLFCKGCLQFACLFYQECLYLKNRVLNLGEPK